MRIINESNVTNYVQFFNQDISGTVAPIWLKFWHNIPKIYKSDIFLFLFQLTHLPKKVNGSQQEPD